jgi:hypothetical protein
MHITEKQRLFYLLIFVSFVIIFSACQKQNTVTNPTASNPVWAKTFGGVNSDITTAIQPTSDGGSIVAGNTRSYGAGNDDGFALKLDGSGNVQWFSVFGGSGGDDINSIQQTQDGGYIMAGQTNSFGATLLDVWTVKLSSSGSVQWSKFYRLPGNDFGMSIRQVDDGGYIVAGYTDSYGAGNNDVLLIKIDAMGFIQWAKVYGGIWNDYATSVKAFHSPTAYIVAGYSYSNPAQQNSDILLISLDSAGTMVWAKYYGGSGDNKAYDLQITSSNGYVIAGTTYSYGLSSGDAYIFTTDGSGYIIWSKTIGGSGLDEALSVIQNKDGRFVAAGKTNSFGAGNNDVFILQLDGYGMFNWMKVFGGQNSDIGTGVVQLSNGNYLVSATTMSYGAGNNDAFVLNLRNDGTGCLPNNSIVPTGGDPITTVTDAANITSQSINYETDDAPVIFNPVSVSNNKLCSNP